MKEIINEITQKDDKAAYNKTKEIAAESECSNAYYSYLDDFALLLSNKNSYIRTRAFILCCCQAKWDDGKMKEILPSMYKMFNDPKATVVRQCLKAIKEVVVYCPDEAMNILVAIEDIDLTNYTSAMSQLITKDIEELKQLINEQLNH